MREYILRLLADNALINEQERNKISSHYNHSLFSLNRELRAVLYLGIVLLTTGLGIAVYKNIDTIGHTAIIFCIAVACSSCFYYCFKLKQPYSNTKAKTSSTFADYILLLGCLLFITLEGYLQFQYSLFGSRYDVATFLPALLFFFLAYYFDHKGVLSLAITSLGTWVGLVLTPLDILKNDFYESIIIYKALSLGFALVVAGFMLKKKNIKEHFTLIYYNFASLLLFTSSLAGLFELNYKLIFFLALASLCYGFISYAIRTHSFYFLLLSVVFGYTGLTYLVFRIDAMENIYFILWYFIITCTLVILFLIFYKRILKIRS